MDTYLSDIILKLEAASGPDRGLDLMIYEAAFGPYPHPYGTGSSSIFTWPEYTRFIDAALSLVPEGWRYGFEQAGMFDGNDLCEAWLWPFEDSFDPDWRNGDQGYRSCENATRAAHKLPAIAICSAALKARIEKS